MKLIENQTLSMAVVNDAPDHAIVTVVLRSSPEVKIVLSGSVWNGYSVRFDSDNATQSAQVEKFIEDHEREWLQYADTVMMQAIKDGEKQGVTK